MINLGLASLLIAAVVAGCWRPVDVAHHPTSLDYGSVRITARVEETDEVLAIHLVATNLSDDSVSFQAIDECGFRTELFTDGKKVAEDPHILPCLPLNPPVLLEPFETMDLPYTRRFEMSPAVRRAGRAQLSVMRAGGGSFDTMMVLLPE